jgi:mono/diheme cytochrome c family protein
MNQKNNDVQMSGFLPSAVLLGAFGTVLLVLLATPIRHTEVSIAAATAEMTESAPVVETAAPAFVSVNQPFDAQAGYNWACAGCHGADGAGNPPFGESIVQSALLSDQASLLVFLTDAQPPVDPALRYPHPVWGGYPMLSNEQLNAVIVYLDTSQR